LGQNGLEHGEANFKMAEQGELAQVTYDHQDMFVAHGNVLWEALEMIR